MVDSFCWYKEKKWFLWVMVAAQAAKNHGNKWLLTLILNCGENSHKWCDEKGHLLFELERKSMETEATTWSEFQNNGKAHVEQILASEERNPK